MQFVTPEIKDAVFLAGLAEKGALPILAGSLEQSQFAMDAFSEVWNQQAAFGVK